MEKITETRLRLTRPAFECRAAPAPGFRDPGAHRQPGNAVYIGLYGYSWSSATSGISGVDLNFNMTILDPGLTNDRAYGFQLRCLSE
ncbi:hypothetical protein [uncultured Rikenella sp.]|uniref:hypothetical protein n=1 Tax=uncultured Rikenella sp. TaxID=368003 RepID=UPI00262A99CC|nr:hypothetical protein [uncultured Rikenella sp.]